MIVITKEHRASILARTHWISGEVPEVYQNWADKGLDYVKYAEGSAAYCICQQYEEKAEIAAAAEAVGYTKGYLAGKASRGGSDEP